MLALTDLIGRPVSDADGRRAGRLADLRVQLEGDAALVSGLRLRRGRRASAQELPWETVATFEATGATLRDTDGRARPAAGDALWLARDVLDAQIVDVRGARVVRVGDVELERRGDELAVVAVDVGWAALLRRLGLRRVAARAEADAIAWDDVHLASGRGHALQLATAGARVHRLHRAELATLVAELPAPRAAEVLRTVGPGRAATALSATRPEVGATLLEALGTEAGGPVMAGMPADDAVATLRHVAPDSRRDLLGELPSWRADRLRALLAHRPETAAGLMSPDVRTAREGQSAAEVRALLLEHVPPVEGLATVFVLDRLGRPTATLTPLALLAGDPAPAPVCTVAADAPARDVIDLFARHDVLAVAVVDDRGRLIGAVAIDDVLEELLAERLPGHRHGLLAALKPRRRAP